MAGEVGRISISNDEKNHCLRVHIDISEATELIAILEKVKSLFDLTADPIEISNSLSGDKALAQLIQSNPGQRVPGCWDPFEIAVRAIVGQQISVKGATTVIGRIATLYGRESDKGLHFPDAETLAGLDVESLSMPRKRAQAIKDMSDAVANGTIDLSTGNTPEVLVSQLVAIKGIGPWTAQYIAMRAINDPDAFLHNDLVILKVAKHKLGIESESTLLERSMKWRPWRAYAGMHLWRHASQI